MPERRGNTYTFSEIAAWLQMPVHRVTDIAASGGFGPSAPPAPEEALDSSAIPDFIEKLTAAEGIEPRRYDLPPDMETSIHRWEKFLARAYRHPCAYPACLSPSQGRLLRDMILERRPRHVLEIGCFMGLSSVWIASALEEIGDGRLDSIDLFEPILPWPPHRYGFLADPERYARDLRTKAALANRIRFHRMSSFDLARNDREVIGEPVDFAFIDGDHSFGGCLHDFMTVAPHVTVGGAILLHDTNPEFCGWDGPRRVLDRYVIPSPHFRVTEIPTEPRNYGMALIEKIADPPPPGPGVKLRLFLTRLKSRLRRSGVWRAVQDTPVGRFLLRVARGS